MEGVLIAKQNESLVKLDCKELEDSGYDCSTMEAQDRSIGISPVPSDDLAEHQTSSDSGMCASDGVLSKMTVPDDDSDDEEIVSKSTKKKSRWIMDDDSSDDETNEKIDRNSDCLNNGQSKKTDYSDTDNDCEKEDNFVKKRRGDNLNEDASSKTKENQTATKNKMAEPTDEMQCSNRYKSILQNSDLFDSEEPDYPTSAEVGLTNQDSSEESEGKQENPKQGTSKQKQRKNTKTLKSIRKQKEDLMKLHSDNQRLLRESRVSLPYHQPEQKSLDYFLNRRKNVPSKLKPTLSDLKEMVKSTCAKPRHRFCGETSSSGSNSILETSHILKRDLSVTSNLGRENKTVLSDDDDDDLPPSGIFKQDCETENTSQIMSCAGDLTNILKNVNCCEPLDKVQLEVSAENLGHLTKESGTELNSYQSKSVHCEESEPLGSLSTEGQFKMVPTVGIGASEHTSAEGCPKIVQSVHMKEDSKAKNSLQLGHFTTTESLPLSDSVAMKSLSDGDSVIGLTQGDSVIGLTQGDSVAMESLPQDDDPAMELLPQSETIQMKSLSLGNSVSMDSLPLDDAVAMRSLSDGDSVKGSTQGNSVAMESLPQDDDPAMELLPQSESIQMESLSLGNSVPMESLPLVESVPMESLPLGDSVPIKLLDLEDCEIMTTCQVNNSKVVVGSQVEEDSEEMGSLQLEADSEEICNVRAECVRDKTIICNGGEQCIKEEDRPQKLSIASVHKLQVSSRKSHLLTLPVLEQVISLTPKLSGGGSSAFISFDDEGTTAISPGVQDLMHRFVKHTRPALKLKVDPQKVELNIVKKEVDELGKEVLVADTVSVTVNGSNAATYESPSLQRELLKKALRAKIAIRREQERQKRIQLCELDNEEGFVETDDQVEEDEEEEAEMTDQTDSEEEEESEEEVVVRKPKKRSAFIDDEAEDDDAEDENEEDGTDDEIDDGENDKNDNSDTENTDAKVAEVQSEAVTLNCTQEKKPLSCKFKRTDTEDLFPQDYSDASFCSSVKSTIKDKSDYMNSSMDGSFEFLGSEIQPYQPYGGNRPKLKRTDTPSDSETELFTPLSKMRPTQSKFDTQLSLPVDDNEELDDSFARDHDFDFNFPESSLLTSKPFRESSSSHKALIGKDSETMPEDMDELLSLCSGRFGNSQTPSQQPPEATRSNKFPSDSQNNMDELVGLCSGQFANSIPQDGEHEDSMISLALESDGGNSHDENESEVFKEDGGNESSNNEDKDKSDNDGEEEDEGSENEEELENTKFGVFGKKGKIRHEFLEEEAELSGSEMDSDENEDIPEDEDIMEEEEGDRDDVLSEDELRDQVGRVHLKSMLDEDKRDLRLFQEVFLQDGDLHSEGRGRERKFRWKDVDGNSVDGFDGNPSDEEAQDDAADQEDILWRMQRSEREKWLCENKVDDKNDQLELEGSQLLKFKTTETKKRGGVDFQLSENKNPEVEKLPDPFISPKNMMKMMRRRGSFLSRSKESLTKLAEIARQSSDSNPNGPKHSRNFVFAAKSPPAKENSKKVGRSASTNSIHAPPAKRPKFDRTFSADQSRRNSIFSFL